MVSRSGSPVKGHAQGRAISIHEPTHEETTQGGNEEECADEHREEIHVGQQIVFEGSDLRHMMQTIIDRLPPAHIQDGACQAGPELRPKYKNSRQARNARCSKRHRFHQPSQGVSSCVSGDSSL